MSIDCYLGRRYNNRSYNCLHFARDVWYDLTGVDITDRLSGLFNPIDRIVKRENLATFTRLDSPVDPCLVLMQRPRVDAHIGVFIRGKVLHIQPTGVQFVPLEFASRGFKTVRYYR